MKSPVMIKKPSDKWENDDFFEVPAADPANEKNDVIDLGFDVEECNKNDPFEFDLPLDQINDQ